MGGALIIFIINFDPLCAQRNAQDDEGEVIA